MASYYNYFDNSAAGQHTRSEIIAAADDFGMGITQDIDCANIVGAAATFSSKVNCSGTTYPFYPPRVTNSERDNMNNLAAGGIIWNTTSNEMQFYNGSGWRVMDSSAV